MTTFSVNIDTTRGSYFGSADASVVDWLIITGGIYPAPAGQFALSITLQDYAYGADPAHSVIQLLSWGVGATPTVLLTIDYRGFIDNVISGAGSDRIIGHDGQVNANYLQGDDIYDAGGNDWIEGKMGDDTILGTGGSDTIYGGDDNDKLYGDWDRTVQDQGNFAAGSDAVYGGSGADTVYGDEGNNTLDGGIGFDHLSYAGFFYDGNMKYRVAIDVALGTAVVNGTDMFGDSYLFATDSFSNFEHYVLTDGNDVIHTQQAASVLFPQQMEAEGGAGDDSMVGGSTAQDYLFGDAGNDTLVGGGPDGNFALQDQFFGGAGNDTFILTGNASLTELAFGGTDSLRIAYAHNTILQAEIENLVLLAGAGASSGTGNGAANAIQGNNFANTLAGLAGADTITGGGGNDSMDGGNDNDRLFGGAGNDRVLGGSGSDYLSGDADIDVLLGGAGNDSLNGGSENDLLYGGLGRDMLTGGLNNDRFVFNSAAEAGLGRNRDMIMDFVSGTDKLQLRAIAAGQHLVAGFTYGGTAGEIHYDSVSGVLKADLDGNRVTDYELKLAAGTVLLASDLIL